MNCKLCTPKTVLSLFLSPAALLYGQSTPEGVHGDPFHPVGKLAVNPTFVSTGVKPNLDWSIDYPAVFEDLAIVAPSGSIETTEDVTVVVQCPGASGGCDRSDMPVALWIRVGASAGWNLLHLGTGNEVNPSRVLYSKKHAAGTQIDLAARSQHPSGGWNSIVWTLSSTPALKHFGNGDPSPTDIADFLTGDVESFLTPYLTEDFSKFVIGPKELIYLFELETGTSGSNCEDYQDLAVTVQFITKNNDGHGNNYDGVDVSNPGSGGGGPNGEVDPSGDIDDEM